MMKLRRLPVIEGREAAKIQRKAANNGIIIMGLRGCKAES